MVRWRDIAGVSWVVVAGWLPLGVVAVWARLPAADERQRPAGGGFLAAVEHFDAGHYRSIAEEGYTYRPGWRSEVAFFPAYPLAGRVASRATTLGTTAALLAVANACFAASIVAFWAFLAARGRRSAPSEMNGTNERIENDRRAMLYSLSAFLLWPPTFFLRMPYSEAMFLLPAIVALDWIQRGRSATAVALVAGMAAAVRPVGVALVAPLAWHALRDARDWKSGLRRIAWLVPLGCWGLLAYMAYLQYEFGDALAFARTQANWRLRPDEGWLDKIMSLASLEPFWGVYLPGSRSYFGGWGDWNHVVGRMRGFNPLFFGGTAALVAVGAWRRWLTAAELLLCAGLLGVPYLTRAYEMCLESHARFAAVVFPVYIVLGRWLAGIPRPAAWAFLGFCGAVMIWFTVCYAAARPFF